MTKIMSSQPVIEGLGPPDVVLGVVGQLFVEVEEIDRSWDGGQVHSTPNTKRSAIFLCCSKVIITSF
jgi:hypothetical protein